ncbi:MAG: carbohydrate-binding protein, partial [Chryseobacterium sp.]
NYDALVKYLNKGGNKPKESNVYSGLMELAIYSRLEQTIIHRDVIDAMIRQPSSNETKPFKNHLIKNGSMIYAVDYDLGRNNIAYFDLDTADYHVSTKKRSAGNRGRIYRNDGVDIAKDSTEHERYYVNNVEKGEWLQYTVNVPKSDNFTLKMNTAAAHGNGRMTIIVDGKMIFEAVAVPETGSEKKFVPFEIKDVPLKKGTHKIRIVAGEGGYNFSYIQFIK